MWIYIHVNCCCRTLAKMKTSMEWLIYILLDKNFTTLTKIFKLNFFFSKFYQTSSFSLLEKSLNTYIITNWHGLTHICACTNAYQWKFKICVKVWTFVTRYFAWRKKPRRQTTRDRTFLPLVSPNESLSYFSSFCRRHISRRA